VEDFFGAVDDYFSACLTDILYFVKCNFGAARSNAVDAFDACCDESGGNAVKAGGNGYCTISSIVFRVQVDFDSAYASSFLELAEIKFWTEKSFCLPKNCSNNIGFFNYTFNFKSSVYNVLYRKCLGCSRKYATPM
jgi:hypothetical protein